ARSYADRGIERVAEPLIGEQRARRTRRTGRIDRRVAHVVALRKVRRAEEFQLQQEVAMTKEKNPFTPASQAVKDRLLRERVPDLDLTATDLPADAIYRVLARDSEA